MSRVDKLLSKFLRKPKDFTYHELVYLLGYFGYSELKRGKTSGSRSAFVHQDTKHIIRLHKPHPGSTLRRYQIDEIINELTKSGRI